jgi:hypothetical protein
MRAEDGYALASGLSDRGTRHAAEVLGEPGPATATGGLEWRAATVKRLIPLVPATPQSLYSYGAVR